MTPADDHAELQRRLAALSQQFIRLSARLAEAGQLLVDQQVLPDDTLVADVRSTGLEFDDLRRRTVATAEALSMTPAPVADLAALTAAVHSIAEEQHGRARHAEAEAMRRAEDEARRAAEQEAARRRAAEDEARRKADDDTRRMAADEEKRRAAEEARRKAAEEAAAREAAAEEAKRKAAEEEASRRAEEEAARKAAEEAARKVQEETARKAAEEAARKAQEEAARKADEEVRRKSAEDERRKAEDEAGRKAAEQARRKADEEAKRKADEEARRKADEDAKGKAEEDARRRVEAAEPKPTGEQAAEPAGVAATVEDPGLETAQWWISASAAWGNMKSRRVTLPDAIRDVLGKYPYLFSVPVQTSTDYEDGLLAYGFAVLLEYIDREVPGFVSEALSRLPARKGATLGRRLYDYLAEPLRSRYPEFIKAVLLAGLPKPGMWVNGGLEDSDAATTLFRRTSQRIGDDGQRSEQLVQDLQRFVDHQFAVAVAPLTTRMFRVGVADVREPRDVELQLTQNGVATDLAWVVALEGPQAMPQVRRQERQAMTITGVGGLRPGVWIAVFNADPETEKTFELTVGLRRKGQTAARAAFRRPPR